MNKQLSVVALALTLGLAACGGDDDGGGGGDQALVDAIAADLVAGNTGAVGEITEEQADCVAEGVVDGVGADQLAEYGITAEDVATIEEVGLSEEDATAVADAMTECVDIEALFLEGMAADGTMPQEAVDCIADAIDEDMLTSFLVAGLTGGDPEAAAVENEALMTAVTDCMTTAGG